MRIITFYGVQIRPLEPLIDWIKGVDVEGEAHLGTCDYTIPHFLPPTERPSKDSGFSVADLSAIKSQGEAEECLKENYRILLINDLTRRCPGLKELPEVLDWEEFQVWFSWTTYRARADKRTGRVLEWTLDEARADRFEFDDELLDEEGELDEQKIDDWLASLYERLRYSPEGKAYRDEFGLPIHRNFEDFFRYLFETRKKTIDQVEVADLDYYLKDYIPFESMTRGLRAKALIHELYAFFKYFDRVFAFGAAPQLLAYLRTPGLIEEVDGLIRELSIWSRAGDFDDKIAARIERKKKNKAPQIPYVDDDSTPSRNDPCSCGSGRKYKRCCMRKK